MSEKQHTVGTYNMSFMSDLTIPIGPGMAWASEGAFLARLQVEKEPDKIRRSYWTNAKNLLKTFIEQKKPSVVGLQEMNVTAPVSETGTEATGTEAINKMLEEVGKKYQIESDEIVINPNVKPAVSIIYDTTKIGTKVASKIVDNKNQPGRPILLLLTELDGKKYLSVSMHGAQDPKLRLNKDDFNKYMVDKNKKFLEETIVAFLTENEITDASQLSGVFITGDFNDRYDGIKNIDILGETTKATYSGKAPKACCYNWDSSCPDADVEKDFETDIETDLKNNYKTCTEPASMKDAAGAKMSLPGDRGNTKNYRYAGDKVFVLNPTAELKIFRPDGFDGVSTESDHEFVYYEPSPSVEGGRKSRRASRKNRKGKRGKSRRRNRKSRR